MAEDPKEIVIGDISVRRLESIMLAAERHFQGRTLQYANDRFIYVKRGTDWSDLEKRGIDHEELLLVCAPTSDPLISYPDTTWWFKLTYTPGGRLEAPPTDRGGGYDYVALEGTKDRMGNDYLARFGLLFHYGNGKHYDEFAHGDLLTLETHLSFLTQTTLTLKRWAHSGYSMMVRCGIVGCEGRRSSTEISNEYLNRFLARNSYPNFATLRNKLVCKHCGVRQAEMQLPPDAFCWPLLVT
ncbi:hypothetical protein [Caballeronia sp. LZ032]|uniref:hypothetical protein n=1 Tax=Caballeronia sp. LZ032 TaxID=3038565 RepID=UPI0028573DB5|nr:hypothetical protein [Caballeronia sp. LZ032]MDR5878799.1 hypothetical protein [Caballeronia sp. LZ032]